MEIDKEKFESKFKRLPSGCWEWMDSRNRKGYGIFCIGRKTYKASRISYELYIGLIPKFFMDKPTQINHSCNNKWCVNPDHLHLGNHSTNMQEAVRDGLMKCKSKAKVKLSAQDVVEIKRLSQSKIYSRHMIAKKYHISTHYIGMIMRGKRWSHINLPE